MEAQIGLDTSEGLRKQASSKLCKSDGCVMMWVQKTLSEDLHSPVTREML